MNTPPRDLPKTSPTQSLNTITDMSYNEFKKDFQLQSEEDNVKESKKFKYNCHTRTEIVKRSKKYKAKAKLQKLARRKNRK